MASLADTPHHDGSALYVSTEAPALGDELRVRLRVPHGWGEVVAVRTRSNPDHEPRYTDAHLVHRDARAAWWEAPLYVDNPVHGYRWMIETAGGVVHWLSAAGLSRIETRDVDDFRIVTHPPAPDWGREQILYQVFPDRFARSAAADARELPAWAVPAEWDEPVAWAPPGDPARALVPVQFYGGDLDGVREHLDHLVELGVTMLYLTPVFPGRSNHRYDAESFAEVDPLLGGDEALVRLVSAAHERGLRVIGDLTTNHSGDAHEWFRAAHLHPGAPESDFYLWLDDEQRHYASWLGVDSLPKFDWRSQELRRRFIEGPDSVVGRWLQTPVLFDGWRIDVSTMTGRWRDLDLNEEVRTTIRRTMLEVAPDTLLLAESTNDAAPDFPGDAWHGAMTYANFTRPLWNWLAEPGSPAGGGLGFAQGRTSDFGGDDFLAAHLAFAAAFPWRVRLHTMNALDTHDTPRFAPLARAGALPVAVGLSLTLPGIPVIWAGAELGLPGRDGEESRQPMPWGRFTADSEPLATYRELIALRRAHPALTGGGIRWLHASAEAVAFVREAASESVLVIATRSATVVELGDELPVTAVPLTGLAQVADGTVTTTGPAFLAFSLPGITLPPSVLL